MKDATELLKAAEQRWREISQLKSTRSHPLLKLSVLRELAREVHRGTSDNLAGQATTQASEFLKLEARLDDYRDRDIPTQLDPLDQIRLMEWLTHPALTEKSTRAVPDQLFRVFPKAKLDRNDRTWETALLAEGLRCGWRLWKLDTTLSLNDVETWNQQLIELLWPNGICLFTEAGQSAQSLSDWDQKLWHGRWFCLLHRKYKKARQIPTLSPALHPQWRLLFSAPLL